VVPARRRFVEHREPSLRGPKEMIGDKSTDAVARSPVDRSTAF
jgi:hypothetical protein